MKTLTLNCPVLTGVSIALILFIPSSVRSQTTNSTVSQSGSLISGDRSSGRVSQKTELKLVILEQSGLIGKRPESKAGAYFVRVEDAEVEFFRDRFKENIPRIDVIGGSDREFPNMRQDVDGVVKDRKTRKQAEVFEFDKIEIKGNQATVEVTVGYSSMAIAIHTYTLTLELGKWVVRSHTTKAIA